MAQLNPIRNFCIIAHVDHGKSTLADRLLELTGTVPSEKMRPQYLDQNPIERERGITIKLAPVRMNYTLDAINYTLNLIDTPGHVDFSYEVSRSLAAVEGAVLLVDATQGVEAQTLAHGLLAQELGLTLIPVINKIDLPNADIPGVKKQVEETFGFKEEEILLASAKNGQGVEKILEVIVERIPSPKSSNSDIFRALIFDSFFDSFKGVIAQIRVVDGEVPPVGAKIKFLGTGAEGEVSEVGVFTPELNSVKKLSAGEIGYLATSIKQPSFVRVGDTISTKVDARPLSGYKEVKPMVFVGLYPVDSQDFSNLKEALAKFQLNDPAFSYEPEQSTALGAGFRCGFLGLLHAEVVRERLSREFNLNILYTTPSVEYLIDKELVNNPGKIDPMQMKNAKEPWVVLKIFTPKNFIGDIMTLVQDKRGKFRNTHYFGSQVELSCEMPLSEMVTDFYDKLKSVSSGFASLDWNPSAGSLEFRPANLARVDILVAQEKVDALSVVAVSEKAQSLGRRMVEKLKELIPRQNFEVAIQAAISGKIIARENIPALRKDVTAKLYGGDRTRKDKLLEKQKKGKKRMKMVGRVEIPQEAFLSLLKTT